MKECPVCKRTFRDHITFCPADGAALSTTLSIVGSTLDGQYHIDSLLGQGTMGAVYLARHILLGDKVAIKILPPLRTTDAEWLRRFRREMQAARRFRHPNAVTVYDLRTTSDGLIYIVMEFVEGHTLDVELKRSGRLTPQQAFSILEPIMSVLAVAHSMGIIHGDLKPEHIMLLADTPLPKCIKVLDFGLAKIKFSELLGSSDAAQTWELMGSPFYMAPEQWSDEEPDARADIYSLGVILYQMLAGEVPFKGSSIFSIMNKHLTLPPPSFQSMGVSVPPQIEAVVRHALEKEVADRIDSIDSFLKELRGAMSASFEPKQLDENVQFTVFRPRAMEPENSYRLIVYAHLSEARPDAPADAPHPKEEVKRKAREALREKFHDYTNTATDSRQAIPHEGVLTFIPVFEGIEFLQERHTLLWEGPVHELIFNMKARREMEGQTARGHLRVYLGIILIAEVSLAILVNTQKAREYEKDPLEACDSFSPYRKIFASYSHDDEMVVVQFERLVEAFGDEYLRDVRDIRAGEAWSDRIEELIRGAHIFQLFWSKNSMRSKFVRKEWEYALTLHKPNFIRPLFWEEPMPTNESEGLPPEALLNLQFKRVPTYEQRDRIAGQELALEVEANNAAEREEHERAQRERVQREAIALRQALEEAERRNAAEREEHERAQRERFERPAASMPGSALPGDAPNRRSWLVAASVVFIIGVVTILVLLAYWFATRR